MLNFALIFLLNVALASMVILFIALLAARMVVSLPLKHAFLMTGLIAILVAPAVIGVGLSQGWGQLSWPELSGLSHAIVADRMVDDAGAVHAELGVQYGFDEFGMGELEGGIEDSFTANPSAENNKNESQNFIADRNGADRDPFGLSQRLAPTEQNETTGDEAESAILAANLAGPNSAGLNSNAESPGSAPADSPLLVWFGYTCMAIWFLGCVLLVVRHVTNHRKLKTLLDLCQPCQNQKVDRMVQWVAGQLKILSLIHISEPTRPY